MIGALLLQFDHFRRIVPVEVVKFFRIVFRYRPCLHRLCTGAL